MLMQLHNILLRTAPRLVQGCVLLPLNQTRRYKECFGRFRYTQWEPSDKHVQMNRKERPDRDGALRKTHCDELVAIVVVIVVIPIAIGVPATTVFIPPAVALVPAAFSRLVQIVASAVRLPAVPAMMLHGSVQFAIGFVDAALALIVTFGGCPGCTCGSHHPQQCDQHHAGKKLLPSRLYGHGFSILHVSPLLDWDLAPSYKTLH